MIKNKFYTVWVGRNPGIYSSWKKCEEQIYKYKEAAFKGFPTREQAEKAFLDNPKNYRGLSKIKPVLASSELKNAGLPIKDSICVDGAWNTRTNATEYQGVRFADRQRVFHAGPFTAGTNNIAEFLAIVHALSYCKTNSLPVVIYSDSRIAISWVNRKKAATRIEVSEETSYILSVVRRAELWLKDNEYKNSVLKWETAAWGENPADFGRK